MLIASFGHQLVALVTIAGLLTLAVFFRPLSMTTISSLANVTLSSPCAGMSSSLTPSPRPARARGDRRPRQPPSDILDFGGNLSVIPPLVIKKPAFVLVSVNDAQRGPVELHAAIIEH
jgi:hypothetical protein